MVGFLRKKKSDKVMLGDDTVLERKGKVDGSSLLDDNGDPTNTTLYNQNRVPLKKGGRKGSDEENNAPPLHANGQQYPPANYPYGQTYPPQQHGGAFGGQSNGYGGSFNNSRGSFGQQQQQPSQQYPVQYGHSQPQQQQYPVQYGSQPQYGNNQSSYGNNQPQYGNQQPQYGNQQPQYPVQYGNYPPPPQQQPTKKSSFFRIPGYGKK